MYCKVTYSTPLPHDSPKVVALDEINDGFSTLGSSHRQMHSILVLCLFQQLHLKTSDRWVWRVFHSLSRAYHMLITSIPRDMLRISIFGSFHFQIIGFGRTFTGFHMPITCILFSSNGLRISLFSSSCFQIVGYGGIFTHFHMSFTCLCSLSSHLC